MVEVLQDAFGHELRVGDKVWLYRHSRETVGTITRLRNGTYRTPPPRVFVRIPGEYNERSSDGAFGVAVTRCHRA